MLVRELLIIYSICIGVLTIPNFWLQVLNLVPTPQRADTIGIIANAMVIGGSLCLNYSAVLSIYDEKRLDKTLERILMGCTCAASGIVWISFIISATSLLTSTNSIPIVS